MNLCVQDFPRYFLDRFNFNAWLILKVLYPLNTLNIGTTKHVSTVRSSSVGAIKFKLASNGEDRTVETYFDEPMFSVSKEYTRYFL